MSKLDRGRAGVGICGSDGRPVGPDLRLARHKLRLRLANLLRRGVAATASRPYRLDSRVDLLRGNRCRLDRQQRTVTSKIGLRLDQIRLRLNNVRSRGRYLLRGGPDLCLTLDDRRASLPRLRY